MHDQSVACCADNRDQEQDLNQDQDHIESHPLIHVMLASLKYQWMHVLTKGLHFGRKSVLLLELKQIKIPNSA